MNIHNNWALNISNWSWKSEIIIVDVYKWINLGHVGSLIPMMMIIGTRSCILGIGSFFVTKTITLWLSTMTITNGHMINNYASKWPFLTIMCRNDGSLGKKKIVIFFGDGSGGNNNKSSVNVYNFSFLLQCSLVASLTCFELASNTKVFFVDVTLLWERIRNYGDGK